MEIDEIHWNKKMHGRHSRALASTSLRFSWPKTKKCAQRAKRENNWGYEIDLCIQTDIYPTLKTVRNVDDSISDARPVLHSNSYFSVARFTFLLSVRRCLAEWEEEFHRYKCTAQSDHKGNGKNNKQQRDNDKDNVYLKIYLMKCSLPSFTIIQWSPRNHFILMTALSKSKKCFQSGWPHNCTQTHSQMKSNWYIRLTLCLRLKSTCDRRPNREDAGRRNGWKWKLHSNKISPCQMRKCFTTFFLFFFSRLFSVTFTLIIATKSRVKVKQTRRHRWNAHKKAMRTTWMSMISFGRIVT